MRWLFVPLLFIMANYFVLIISNHITLIGVKNRNIGFYNKNVVLKFSDMREKRLIK